MRGLRCWWSMRMQRGMLAIALCSLLGSCSYVLDTALAPFAPDFLPRLQKVPTGVEVGPYMGPADKPSDYDKDMKQTSWSMPYAMYIFRSEISPYDGMRLVGRSYLPEAARAWTGQSYRVVTHYNRNHIRDYDYVETRYPVYDFTLVPGYDAAHNLYNRIVGSSTFVDTTAPAGDLYYRMSHITLYRSVSVRKLKLNYYDSEGKVTGSSEQSVTNISYSLEPSSSGWAVIRHEP